MTRFIVPAAELHSALAMVLPHASADNYRPEISGVQFTVSDRKHLELFATDRFTMARFTIELPTPDDPADEPRDGWFLLPMAAAKDWLKLSKPRSWSGHIEVSADTDPGPADVTFCHATIKAADTSQGVQVRVQSKPFQYERLIPERADAGPPVFGVDSKHLIKFKGLGMLRFEHGTGGPRKPFKVTVPDEDRFLAVVMPVTLPEHRDN